MALDRDELYRRFKEGDGTFDIYEDELPDLEKLSRPPDVCSHCGQEIDIGQAMTKAMAGLDLGRLRPPRVRVIKREPVNYVI